MFERADRIGGLLRYGIPEFKMEKRALDRRLDQMRAEGVEFVTGANVGVDVDPERLRQDHDALLLTGGACQARDLPDPRPGARGHPFRDGVPPAPEPALRGGRHPGRGLHHRARQARDDPGRRRHGGGLPGHGAPTGRPLGPPDGDPAAAAGPARAGQPMAPVPERLSGLLGPRGGRRARLRRLDEALPRRRARARRRAGGRACRGHPRGRAAGLPRDPRLGAHHAVRAGPSRDGLPRAGAPGDAREARRPAHRARQRVARRELDDQRAPVCSPPATCSAGSP